MRGRHLLEWSLLIGGLVGLTAGVTAFLVYFRPSPEEALRRFHAQLNDGQTAEDQLVCPLILAGPGACIAIIRDIEDRSRPLRRYAIGAVGNLHCEGALPLLNEMLHDDGEQDYFRGDALEALWLIDQPAAEIVAKPVSARSDYLGATAQRLLRGHLPPTKSYWDAVLCTHD